MANILLRPKWHDALKALYGIDPRDFDADAVKTVNPKRRIVMLRCRRSFSDDERRALWIRHTNIQTWNPRAPNETHIVIRPLEFSIPRKLIGFANA